MGKIYQALEKSGKSGDSGKPLNQVEQEAPVFETDSIDSAPLEKESVPKKSETLKGGVVSKVDEQLLSQLSPDLVAAIHPQSIEAEQFRNLKNNILFPGKGSPPKTIMVTSTSASDGKSFVASNLAVSIARSIDEYVLLMDCDLRASSLGSLFGYGDAEGLTEYLTHGLSLSSLLQNTFLEKLKVLPAGATPDNPSELLSSEQMRNLINEARLRYSDRYVIIDTPPPYVTSETSALARQVDGVVLVVRQRVTRKQDLHDVIDIYGKEKIIGIVYNDASSVLPYGTGKYGYGKYGYGYGKK